MAPPPARAPRDTLTAAPAPPAGAFLDRPPLLLRKLVHRATAWVRLKPDFLVIGAQKAGTTSLYHHLATHPCVAPAVTREVHFFDYRFAKGPGWYRSHFPTLASRACSSRLRGRKLLTGESSPYYLFHPLAPARAARLLPAVKLIALLRNPVDRAYSHYRHNLVFGLRDPVRNAITARETLSFEEAIEREPERLAGEVERMLRDERYQSFGHLNYSYLARGLYAEQLRRWWDVFPRERILVLSSEAYLRDPAPLFRRVLEFLGLPAWEPDRFESLNAGSYPPMAAATRERLAAYFEPHNRRLYTDLRMDFGWE